MKKKNEINELQKENRMLRAELARAEKRIRILSKDSASEITGYVSGKADRYAYSNHYLGFLFMSLKASNIYNKTKTVIKFFSRFRIVSLLVKIITSIVVFLETSAHLILFSTIALITLPISAVFGLITFTVAFLGSSRANKKLASLPYKKNVYVFFPQNVKRFKGNNFFKGWVDEIASNKKNLVIIVSPAFWKRSGYVKGKYYLHYRKDAENIFMIRNYYFFSFRRNVLNNSLAENVYMIH